MGVIEWVGGHLVASQAQHTTASKFGKISQISKYKDKIPTNSILQVDQQTTYDWYIFHIDT